jgi:KDO2-lipid IV(A) lauroyltransferase
MSRHNRNNTVDFLNSLWIRPILALFRVLPYSLLKVLAWLLGGLAYRLGGRHRRRVLDQMRLVFRNEKSEAEIEALARLSFRHLMHFIFDTIRISRINASNWEKFIHPDDIAVVKKWMERDEPAFFVTAHLGGFQQMVQVVHYIGIPMASVQRPLDNPYLDTVLQKQRTSGGVVSVSKFESFTALRRYIREGRTTGLVMDQDGGKRGYFSNFMGYPASTWTSAAELQLLFKIPIMVLTVPRVGFGPQLRFSVHDTIEYDAERAKAVRRDEEAKQQLIHEVTDRVNAALSKGILQAPEQWLWQHRRWKTRPKGENLPRRDGVPTPWVEKKEE